MNRREWACWIILGIVAGLAMALLNGCAIIEPQRVNAELQHTSHVTQHFSQMYDGRHYGYDAAGLDLHWQYGRVGADVFEGAVLGHCGNYYNTPYCEGIYGSREVFSARLDVALWSKP